MSTHYKDLCHKHHGRAVEIKTKDGNTHRGIIRHVDNDNVYLRPMGGGFGYGYGFGAGFGTGIAFGAIATLAVLPFFFW